MGKLTVIAPKTAAESTGVVVDCSEIKSETITILADTLAAAEEVDLEIDTGKETYKLWISNSAGAYKLTATQYMLALPNPGGFIRIKKDATTTACGVIITWPEATKRGY
jgi:hypothetical protein